MSKTITELTRNLEKYRQQQREYYREQEKREHEKNKERFSEAEMKKGLQLLESKNLMQKTYDYIKNIGLIGEEKNGALLFFILLIYWDSILRYLRLHRSEYLIRLGQVSLLP